MHLEQQAIKADPVTGAVPLTRQSSTAVLNHIISECAGQYVVFDLDSTIIDNRSRSAKIMQEFSVEQNVPLLANARPCHFQNWSATNTMTRIGLQNDEVEQLIELYEHFWKIRFFSSPYCLLDFAISGATSFVIDIRQSGGLVCYLTGRHESMRKGTEASLISLGFPGPGLSGVELLMKPSFSMSDDLFKQVTISDIRKRRQVKSTFDNEPTHINTYRSALQDAVCIHLYTDHSMRPVRLANGIVSIENFER